MAYDLQEQEQLDEFKAFWNKYGNTLLTIVTVALLAVAAYRGWNWYQDRQAAQASGVYEGLRQAIMKRDTAKIKETTGTLMSQYGSTVFGEMGAVLAAKAYVENKDLPAAKTALQWAVDNAKDEEFKNAARLRLSGLLLDEKQYDQANALLNTTPNAAYMPLFTDRRGDILMAQGKNAEAKAAYKAALDKMDDQAQYKQVIRLKYDALGGDAS